ncbi:MAG: hypothetical protein AAFV27_06845 [Pseudomonadota bacterium]
MRLSLALIVFFLAACTASRADPFPDFDVATADPSGIRVITQRPAAAPLETYATVTVRATGPRQNLTEVFRLHRAGAQMTEAAVNEIYRLASGDMDRFRRMQAQVARWKAEDADVTSGSFALDAGACRTGALAAGKVPLSVWVQLSPQHRPLPVITALDLNQSAAGGIGQASCGPPEGKAARG